MFVFSGLSLIQPGHIMGQSVCQPILAMSHTRKVYVKCEDKDQINCTYMSRRSSASSAFAIESRANDLTIAVTCQIMKKAKRLTHRQVLPASKVNQPASQPVRSWTDLDRRYVLCDANSSHTKYDIWQRSFEETKLFKINRGEHHHHFSFGAPIKRMPCE